MNVPDPAVSGGPDPHGISRLSYRHSVPRQHAAPM